MKVLLQHRRWVFCNGHGCALRRLRASYDLQTPILGEAASLNVVWNNFRDGFR